MLSGTPVLKRAQQAQATDPVATELPLTGQRAEPAPIMNGPPAY